MLLFGRFTHRSKVGDDALIEEMQLTAGLPESLLQPENRDVFATIMKEYRHDLEVIKSIHIYIIYTTPLISIVITMNMYMYVCFYYR